MREKSSSLLLVYFVVEVQRHLQAWHMYYSVSSAFERSRVNGQVSGACCVWTGDFFDNDFGPFALSSLCGSSLRELRSDTVTMFNCHSSWFV